MRARNHNAVIFITVMLMIIGGAFGFSGVKAYADTAWGNVGNTGFSANNPSYTSLKVSKDGTLYVAYQDSENGKKATVKKYDGSHWVNVGNPGFSEGQVNYLSLALAKDGTPYVAFSDLARDGKLTVMVYVEAENKWKYMGYAGLTSGLTVYTSIYIDEDGTPYVAFASAWSKGQITVWKYSNQWWGAVGNHSFSAGAALHISLYVDRGKPYVLYRDSGTGNRATLKWYHNDQWRNVGPPGFSSGIIDLNSLYVYDDGAKHGTPYVAFRENFKIKVMKFIREAGNNRWETLGIVDSSTGYQDYPSITVDNEGAPYVAYSDSGNGHKVTVKRYDGGNWVTVGSPGFSEGAASDTSLALYDGVLHLGYLDSVNKVTVKNIDVSAKAITSFKLEDLIPEVTGTINETDKTIALTVPYGTNVTALVPTFETTGSHVKVGDSDQVSGSTPQNFTSPVTYTVVAADNSTQDYLVTVTVAKQEPPEAPSNVTAVAGDAKATLSWNAVSDATGYRIYKSETSNSYGTEIETVASSVSNYEVTGLTNGTTYYFVVKATNPGGDSVASNEVSATPQVPAPGAPVLISAIAGNGVVSIEWSPVEGASGYKIYQSDASNVFENEVNTVSGSVYHYDAIGLTNGTTYYFVVKATSPGGPGVASNEVSATPVTVPAAPTNVSVVAGDRKAMISFASPSDDGGSTITKYEITSSPGNVVMTGTASPMTITGLTNGTSYTFTVKAINGVGKSAASISSNEVVPNSLSNDEDGSDDDEDSENTTRTEPPAPEPANTGVDILVNGKMENAGTASTDTVNGQSVTAITVIQQKLEDKLAAEGQGAMITISVNTKSDVVVGELNGQMIKSMENKQAILELKTDQATYKLPAEQININAISDLIGKMVDLQDIKVQIEIAAPTADWVKVIDDASEKGTFTLVAPPIDFTIKGMYGDKTIEVTKFTAYVERTLAIPEGVDPNRITTGIVVEPDGTVRHVPTKVEAIDGKYYAIINSMTNSTYCVVWHPLEFSDVSSHWAKDTVNDMGSRMVINGTGNGMFRPDHDITRAEFVAIIVRGLGLKMEIGTSEFSDVKTAAWYHSAMNTAYSYRLISGFEDGTFRPNDKITREEAMVIINKAMTITNLKVKPAVTMDATLRSFVDAAEVSSWAQRSIAENVQSGIISGRSGTTLAPKAYITRAEAAAIVHRLLQKSGLI